MNLAVEVIRYDIFELLLMEANKTISGGFLVTMAWHELRLQMEGWPPDMEGSCKYIE